MYVDKYVVRGCEEKLLSIFGSPIFLADRARMRSLYPVRLWKERIEDILNEASCSKPGMVQHLKYCTGLDANGVTGYVP